jgi:signal peptidase II
MAAGGLAAVIWFEAVLAAILVLVTDQASKAVVLRTRPQPSNLKRQFLLIRQALNRRGALASFTPRMLLLAWGVTVALVALALYSGDDVLYRSELGSVGFGVAVGGATGNMVDRMRQGAIVDFIAIGRWPVFNLADVAIVLGIALVLLSMGWATNAPDSL